MSDVYVIAPGLEEYPQAYLQCAIAIFKGTFLPQPLEPLQSEAPGQELILSPHACVDQHLT